MFIAAVGIAFGAMVGPLEVEPVVRISRPGGGPPEVVRELASATRVSGAIEVPGNAVGGGGSVTVVGGADAIESPAETGAVGGEPLALYTEQLFRAFGYDRDHFGYAYIDYPGLRGHRGRGHIGRGHGGRERPAPYDAEARIRALPRELQPIEYRFPAVPGR